MREDHTNLGTNLVAGRFRLEHEMARGGMGAVWVARDEKLGRLVAVKIMARELASRPEARQRFELEALAAAKLRSNHVVEVYDYGIQDGVPYIVMELLEGENLGQRLRRDKRLGLTETGELMGQICTGLKAAHAAGLVHRDLKPTNVFLTQRDGAEVVKILDFGVVKAVDIEGMTAEEATVSGMLLGTPQYMSPEQARATRELDQRSDLWSLGVILFRLLTGVSPFKGESVGDIVLKICSDPLPSITETAPDLPRALEPFFERAFSRDVEGRFQSAQEMAEAFHGVLIEVGATGVAFGKTPLGRSGMGYMRPSQPGATGRRASRRSPPPAPSGPLVPARFAAELVGRHRAHRDALVALAPARGDAGLDHRWRHPARLALATRPAPQEGAVGGARSRCRRDPHLRQLGGGDLVGLEPRPGAGRLPGGACRGRPHLGGGRRRQRLARRERRAGQRGQRRGDGRAQHRAKHRAQHRVQRRPQQRAGPDGGAGRWWHQGPPERLTRRRAPLAAGGRAEDPPALSKIG
ncbi:MAG: serine/threonine-protein kinase [Polyangiaceae bacterium]